jgi:hypothetical protein
VTANRLLLPARSKKTLYLALQPNIAGQGSGAANEARELVGGIKFSVYKVESPSEILQSKTIKCVSFYFL